MENIIKSLKNKAMWLYFLIVIFKTQNFIYMGKLIYISLLLIQNLNRIAIPKKLINKAKSRVKNDSELYNKKLEEYHQSLSSKENVEAGTREFSKPMTEEEFYRGRKRFLKNISLGGNDAVIFNKNLNGEITQQFRFGNKFGEERVITEEEYNNFVRDSENTIENEKEKEEEYEMS